MNLLLIGYLFVFANFAVSQNPYCDYSQNVMPGREYYVYSPNYPLNYPAGAQCRWTARCPLGFNCHLNCTEVNIPQSPSCSVDRLLVSTTGDPQLDNAEYYCGRGSLNVVSKAQNLTVGLISSNSSPGGRFICKLTAQLVNILPKPCRCGYKKMHRIVGGVETKVNEYPMMAGVVYVDIRAIKCGAVIISGTRVMSAAHCIINKKISELAVVVGEHDVNTGDSIATQGFRVVALAVHPKYTESNYNNDISIITVDREIKFSELVGPVCLPFKFTNRDFAGDNVTILGWGTQFPGGPTSNVLRKVDVEVISQPVCLRDVPNVTSRQLCTFTPGKDACQDDSGGPLLYTDPSNGLLYSVGIVSYGNFCASGYPGVNTRVTALLDWIVEVTRDNFCIK